MNTAVVTGGAGFIGSNLVDELVRMGWKVTIIDNLSTGKVENINTSADFINLDISLKENIEKLQSILSDNDFVFHMAAQPRVQPSIDDPITSNEQNTDSTLNLLFACHKARVKKVVFSSSSSIYGNTENMPTNESEIPSPISPYALQKLIGEQYCNLFSRIYGLKTVSLRYFNAFGERQATEGAYCNVIGIFKKQKSENKNLTITNDGEQRRDFVYVGDIVRANIMAALSELTVDGEIINIGSGSNNSVNEIASIFGGNIEYIGDRIEPKESLADISIANNILGWEPTVNVINWLKENI